jgi:hypothetical protein
MTPQQKLIAVREAVRDGGPDLGERLDDLLSDVHLPPFALANVGDPETWAREMAQHVPGVSPETAYAWLSKAMETAGQVEFAAGMVEGRVRTQREMTDTRQALIEALRLVLSLYARYQLRPTMVRDANDPDNPPMTLAAYLEQTLRAAGVDV